MFFAESVSIWLLLWSLYDRLLDRLHAFPDRLHPFAGMGSNVIWLHEGRLPPRFRPISWPHRMGLNLTGVTDPPRTPSQMCFLPSHFITKDIFLRALQEVCDTIIIILSFTLWTWVYRTLLEYVFFFSCGSFDVISCAYWLTMLHPSITSHTFAKMTFLPGLKLDFRVNRHEVQDQRVIHLCEK